MTEENLFNPKIELTTITDQKVSVVRTPNLVLWEWNIEGSPSFEIHKDTGEMMFHMFLPDGDDFSFNLKDISS